MYTVYYILYADINILIHAVFILVDLYRVLLSGANNVGPVSS